ncbi:hypothetical protein MWU54_05805 [Marivita sp. S6314]|uniref:hypothetical protein n=1 Tax=Marivita sp. S6314 TaxID=2926406 RepID=UPI001FF61A86|nr:hypothetical protein [Marivita sp. S6314]MCK0149528.1 hypothetical protein [Marivita sp. S6314]
MIFFTMGSVMLTACSEAGWEGYGPRNQGAIGRAYGYSDRKISENTFYVDYVEAPGFATDAREKAKRRATELCIESGFVRAEFTPQFQNQGDLIMAYGNATCLSSGDQVIQLTEKQRIERRIREIDAEIASYNTSIAASNDGQAIFIDPTLRTIDAITSGLFSRSDQNNIAKLQAERAQLVSRLQSL